MFQPSIVAIFTEVFLKEVLYKTLNNLQTYKYQILRFK
jgi:hypothetical protein